MKVAIDTEINVSGTWKGGVTYCVPDTPPVPADEVGNT